MTNDTHSALSRFAGTLGEEYNLFQMSVPYHEEFQETIGKEIKQYTSTITAEKLIVLEAGTGTGITASHILQADSRI